MRLIDKDGWTHFINLEGTEEHPFEMVGITTGNFDHIRKSENVDIEELFYKERGRDELIKEYSKIQNLLPGTNKPGTPSWLTVPPARLTLSLRLNKGKEELNKVLNLLNEAENTLWEDSKHLEESRKKYATEYAKVATEYATYLATEEHNKKFCKAIKKAYLASFHREGKPVKALTPRAFDHSTPERLHAGLQGNTYKLESETIKALLAIPHLTALAETLYLDPIYEN